LNKKHKEGAKKFLSEELDSLPICFKGRKGQKEKLKAVPNWQERLREYVEELISEESPQNEEV
jgi:hypothetical protein